MTFEHQSDITSERERLLDSTHHDHEDIIRHLQDHPAPANVPYLKSAILLKPKLSYLEYDDYGAYYKKCLWALQAIGTEEAIAAIKECLSAQDDALRTQAAYRLERIAQKAPGAVAGHTQPLQNVPQVHSLGAMALAGLFGGPLAVGYLAYADFNKLGVRSRINTAISLFALALLIWYFVSLLTPPDIISKLAMLLPQLALWTLAVRAFLGQALTTHKMAGGSFHSKWFAVGLGFCTNMLERLFFFLLSLIAF